MSRESFDDVTKTWMPSDEYYALKARRKAAGANRSSLPCPMIWSDIEPYRNVAVDGKMITSRSEHRQMLRDHGLVEVGNDYPKPRQPVELDDPTPDVAAAVQQLGGLRM